MLAKAQLCIHIGTSQPVWCSLCLLALKANTWSLKRDEQLGLNHILDWTEIMNERFWLKNFWGRRRRQGCVGVLHLALGREGMNGLLEVPSSPVFYDSAKMGLQWLLAAQMAVDTLLSATCVCFMAVFIILVDALFCGTSVTGAFMQVSSIVLLRVKLNWGHCPCQHFCICDSVENCNVNVVHIPWVSQISWGRLMDFSRLAPALASQESNLMLFIVSSISSDCAILV